MRLQTKLVVIAGTMAPGVFPAVALGAPAVTRITPPRE